MVIPTKNIQVQLHKLEQYCWRFAVGVRVLCSKTLSLLSSSTLDRIENDKVFYWDASDSCIYAACPYRTMASERFTLKIYHTVFLSFRPLMFFFGGKCEFLTFFYRLNKINIFVLYFPSTDADFAHNTRDKGAFCFQRSETKLQKHIVSNASLLISTNGKMITLLHTRAHRI